MDQVRRISVAEDELGTLLLDELRGHVFHVTTHVALPTIRETGSILVDPGGQAVKTWEYDAYFRSVGCVSLCDLRSVDPDGLELALNRYFFLDPRHGEPDPAFLFLDSAAVADVIPYTEAMSKGAISKMIVPHIEAGYPGDLPLASIREILVVDVERAPRDPVLEILRSRGRPR